MRTLIITLFTTGLVQLSNLSSGMLSGHLLGPAGRGDLEAAKLWPTTIAYIVLLSLGDAVLYHSAAKSYNQRSIFSASLLAGSILSVIGISVGWIWIIPWAYHGKNPQAQTLAYTLLLLVPVTVFGVIFQEQLRGKGQMIVWNWLRIVLAVGFVVFILLFWALEQPTANSVGLAYLLANTTPMVIALLMLIKARAFSIRIELAALKSILSYGYRLHTSAIVALINSKLDSILIQRLMMSADLGLYIVASTYAQLTVTLVNSVTMVVFPKACANDPQHRTELVGVYLRFSLIIVAGTSIALWIAAPWALGLMFGHDFTDAVSISRMLILGTVALSIKEFLLLTFKAFNRTLIIAKGEVVSIVANATLMYFLISYFGLTGAAIAFDIVSWSAVAYLLYLVRADLGISFSQLIRPTYAEIELLTNTICSFLQRLK